MVENLADQQMSPQRIVVDETDVYWVTRGSDEMADGALKSVPK